MSWAGCLDGKTAKVYPWNLLIMGMEHAPYQAKNMVGSTADTVNNKAGEKLGDAKETVAKPSKSPARSEI
jgi:hypothetical protein